MTFESVPDANPELDLDPDPKPVRTQTNAFWNHNTTFIRFEVTRISYTRAHLLSPCLIDGLVACFGSGKILGSGADSVLLLGLVLLVLDYSKNV
jgi:hypothetical protein